MSKPKTPNRVASSAGLGDVDPTYQCVMVNPPKPKRLKSQKVELICEAVTVEGFSRDKDGNDVPNGIKATIPTRVIGIRWPKKRKSPNDQAERHP